ncbi:MAG: hypothetical protein ACHQUB_00350 [Candidatus Saccharimonadia bacterium]
MSQSATITAASVPSAGRGIRSSRKIRRALPSDHFFMDVDRRNGFPEINENLAVWDSRPPKITD